MMPKRLRLGKPLTNISNRAQCCWCVKGLDPGTGSFGICSLCHTRFKALLRSPRWSRLRSQLLRASPQCADPFGYHAKASIPVVARIADHKIPWRFMPSLFWEPSNIQGLCTGCDHDKRQIDGSVAVGGKAGYGQ